MTSERKPEGVPRIEPAQPVARGGGRAAQDRAKEVARSWRDFPGKGAEGVFRVSFQGNEIDITRIEEGSDEHASWVDVWTGGEQPSFRICNPPVLVPDPQGEEEIEEVDPRGRVRTKRYRRDPVAAIAEVIANTRRNR